MREIKNNEKEEGTIKKSVNCQNTRKKEKGSVLYPIAKKISKSLTWSCQNMKGPESTLERRSLVLEKIPYAHAPMSRSLDNALDILRENTSPADSSTPSA